MAKKSGKATSHNVIPVVLRKIKAAAKSTKQFFKKNWIGTVVILLATFIFFWPVITRISSYSEGGDAMFNAWLLARNHHCILRDGCPSYSDANIYSPNKDTLLYSETETSLGLISLPLRVFSQNPILFYNVLTIASFFFAGWFMYLLVKRLSKGSELFAILAGLIFEFAPFKMAAVTHLQNLSIFYLPLIFLIIFNYLDAKYKKYLLGLFLILVLQFYASWYQMVFALVAVFTFLAGAWIFKYAKLKLLIIIAAVTLLAAMVTLPLAKEYTRFSKTNNAKFGIAEQTTYSSSLSDYFSPYQNTILGNAYRSTIGQKLPQIASYNPDSASYHGMILYSTALFLLVITFIRRKRGEEQRQQYVLVVIFALIALVGFVMSLGPLLKIQGSYIYVDKTQGLNLVVPLPYILVGKFLPQLSFIRAIGRASVLTLFGLGCMLAIVPRLVESSRRAQKNKIAIYAFITFMIIIELMPIKQVLMAKTPYSYNLSIPAVYKYVREHRDIDNLVILSADRDYPNAPFPVSRAENVLWSGYHNRKIFNGYSGYTPVNYFRDYDDFVDFQPDDIAKMKNNHIEYIIVDKQLSTSNPSLSMRVAENTSSKLYEDQRYVLYKI